MNNQNMFPLRMLGFGFYWAWLFLTCVSPSLILDQEPVLGLPFEAAELVFRLIFIGAILIVSKKASSDFVRRLLFVLSLACGLLSSILVVVGIAELSVVTVILLGMTDACMFMLWMCFFGNNHIGETAIYLASSYALGAVVCILISALYHPIALGCTLLLPIFSALAFRLSHKSHGGDEEDEGEYVSEGSLSFRLFPFIRRISLALCMYALVFSLVTSVIASNGLESYLVGPFVEAPCCIVVGLALAIAFHNLRDIQMVYRIYRFVPLALSLGLACLLFQISSMTTVSCFLVMSAYLAFEILALNDLCNEVKLRGLSPVNVFGRARAMITLGMLLGWLLGLLSQTVSHLLSPPLFAVVLGVPVVVIASTLVFTEKEIFAVRSATDERQIIEDASNAESAGTRGRGANDPSQENDITSFGAAWNLSNREKDVLPLLLRGKTATYISEKLYIAPGTTKTHIYNIYRKLGVHSKMEMFDMFEDYKSRNGTDDGLR